MNDLISRQDAIDAIGKVADELYENIKKGATFPQRQWFDGMAHAQSILEDLPSAQQWIPCSERLPEEDKDVLIAYRYKEGEGDTSHTEIDITSYGNMYFGGNAVHDFDGKRIKHWRQPFAYFTQNYEVVAWMPLPEPYKEVE